MAAVLVAKAPFAVVYPHGFALGTAAAALDAAGIPHHASAFPYAPEDGGAQYVVYLIDAERLATLGPRETIEHALDLIARAHNAITVVVAQPGSGLAWLASDAHVGGWLTAPVDPVALLATVRNAAALIAAREDLSYSEREADSLLRIGVALSAERDITTLHQLIVRSARELTGSDSGSLFLIEEEAGEQKLRFAVAQTGPKDDGKHIGAMLPISRTSLSGFVATTGDVIRIPDAYAISAAAEYTFNPSFDKATNYRTTSVLCVPMRDHENVIVGVIQLLNKKPDFEIQLRSPDHTLQIVEPYTERDERVLLSLASQAGVALENKALLESIQDLFEQFVRASVKAIEVRDKSTQGHSSRVADLSVAQAEAINAIETGAFAGLHFTSDQVRELRYASLLHDFGKVAVPEYIFGKSKKLPDGRLDTVRLRFLLAMEQIEARAARELFALMKEGVAPGDPRMSAVDERRAARAAKLKDLMDAITDANEPRVVAGDVANVFEEVSGLSYEELGEARPLMTQEELDYLKIPRGSLSNEERKKMEQHVTQSFYFLREIPWTKTPWQNVPEYAYGHHEHLDGTGYPRGLKGIEITPQVRMLTISDVFDALTAKDRPYKPAMPLERALDILVKEFAERGKVDKELLDVFIAKKVYEPILTARDAAA